MYVMVLMVELTVFQHGNVNLLCRVCYIVDFFLTSPWPCCAQVAYSNTPYLIPIDSRAQMYLGMPPEHCRAQQRLKKIYYAANSS